MRLIYGIAILLGGCLLAVSGGASAEAGAFDIKSYAGVGIGIFGIEYKDTASSAKKTVLGGFGKLGMDIGEYLGAEVRVGATTSGSKGAVKLSMTNFVSYLGKVQYQGASDIRIYGLAGGTTAKISHTSGTTVTAVSRNGVSFGGGLEYMPDDQLSLGV
ncbi:MAG: outer membrane beta-barrel protein, partial [Mariprofundaceae bacterium]|nr:outer membrane beta-barrel protein [Mariprofundaceae bacterium]